MHLVRKYDMEYQPAHYGFGVAPRPGTRVVIARIDHPRAKVPILLQAERVRGGCASAIGS